MHRKEKRNGGIGDKRISSLTFHMTWSPTAEKGDSFPTLLRLLCVLVFDDEFSVSSCKIMQMRRQLAAAFEFLTTQ